MATTRERIQGHLKDILAELPTEKLEQVADFAQYLKSREEWAATQEIMADPDMRRDVDEGRSQAERGEGRPWREVQASVRD